MEKTKKYSLRVGLILSLAWLLIASFMFLTSAATEGQTADGKFTWSWSADNGEQGAGGDFNGSLSGNTLTLNIEARSSSFKKGSCGGKDTDAAATRVLATVKNNTGETIRVDKITNNGCSIDDLSEGKVLSNGDTFTLSITAQPASLKDEQSQTSTGTVVITYAVVQNVDITFFGAAGVSYTYEETTLADASSSVSFVLPVGSSFVLPNDLTVSGGTFCGWRVSHDGSLRSSGSSVTVSTDTSIYPVVVADDLVAPFSVNGVSYYFWTDAAYAAETGTGKTIVLNQSYTLPATLSANGVSPGGSKYVFSSNGALQYVVPSNVIFQIPYDDGNTLCTTAPTIDGTTGMFSSTSNSWVKPTVYRKLTMLSGTNFVVNGSISLSGRQCSIQGSNGMPTKATSFIEMASSSSITVNGGGSLYVWGFITGSGTVLIRSGGTVYECFQLRDWRGGTAASSMLGQADEKQVFPCSQYYVQNVEVEMTLESGAIEYAYTCLVASKCFADALVPFIGSAGMFRLANGTIVKDYVESEDRLRVEVAGDLMMSSLVITADAGVTTYDMNSAQYVLPITNNLYIVVKSGTTEISQDMAFLPGTEFVIEKDATVKVAADVNVFVYDLDEWIGEGYVFSQLDVSPLKFVGFKAGLATVTPNARPQMGDAKIVVEGTLDASEGYLYTTSGGSNIVGSDNGKIIVGLIGEAENTYQYDQAASVYDTIPITPAKLKNTTTTYTDYVPTATHGAKTYVYGSDGIWHVNGCAGFNETNTATCTEAGTYTAKCTCYLPCDCHGKVEDIPALGHSWGEWTNDHTTHTSACGREGCEACVTLLLEYRLDSYTWLNATVTAPDGLVLASNDDGYTITDKPINGLYYVVRQIQAKELPKDFDLYLSVGNASLPKLDVDFSRYKGILEANNNTSDATRKLLAAMVAYGEAAEDHFVGGFDGTVAEFDKDNPPSANATGEFNKQKYDGVILETTSVNIWFDETLRLGVSYHLSGDYSTVLQVGLLVGEGWDGKTALTTAEGGYGMAYLVYAQEGTVTPGGSANVPNANLTNSYNFANTFAAEGSILFDLSYAQYMKKFSVRPFVVLQDGGGETHCVYGHQYGYSLEAYVNRMYNRKDAEGKYIAPDSFRNLLVHTWNYAIAASDPNAYK